MPPGQEVAFKTKVPFLFKGGASEISINFYELMDGRGCIHDPAHQRCDEDSSTREWSLHKMACVGRQTRSQSKPTIT